MLVYDWLKNFFYNYQTLIAGLFALAAAYAAWRNVDIRLLKEERDEAEFQKGLARLLLLDIVNAKRHTETLDKVLKKDPSTSVALEKRELIYSHYAKDFPRLPGHLAASTLSALQCFDLLVKMCAAEDYVKDPAFCKHRLNYLRRTWLELEIARKWLIYTGKTPVSLTATEAKEKHLSKEEAAELDDLIMNASSYVTENRRHPQNNK